MTPNPNLRRPPAVARQSHVRSSAEEYNDDGQGGTTAAAATTSSTTPPIPDTARPFSALLHAGELVDSPSADDLGTSPFFPPSFAPATWPGLQLSVRSQGLQSGVQQQRMSANPGHSVTESLRTANLSRASIVVFAEEGGVDARATRSRAQTEDRTTLEPAVIPIGLPAMDGALPENDGMQTLRQQLLEIKKLALSTEDKAKRMHDLMTSDYLAHRALHSPSPAPGPQSPAQHGLDETLSALAPPIDPENPYNLQPSDCEQTISPETHHRPEINGHSTYDGTEDGEQSILGCAHYTRNVKVQCFDCHRWFPCRHCHDAASDLPFPHALQRKKTQNMLCMLCRTPQPAGEVCMNCGQYAAWYYCDKCKLWDNDSNKRIYHCDDCGLCRLGEGLGKDFVHCRRCNVCISISTSAAHPCVERATDSDCPLCLIYLFESQTPVVSLPCGHYMHGTCYKDLMAVTYKCPVCSKSAVNMELSWRKLDDEIAMQPMPEDDEELEVLLPHLEGAEGTDPAAMAVDLAAGEADNAPPVRRPRQAWISCNDCNSRCWTPFHWLGLKCTYCGGYNTNQMPPSSGRETEAERLIRQQQSQPHRHDFTGNAVMRDRGIVMDVELPDVIEIDNPLAVPSSPSTLSPSAALAPGSPSSPPNGPHSPGRYFVQTDEPRRPSFTSSRFPTPSLPVWDNLPRMPDLPRLPDMPQLPRMPDMPQLPSMPNLPRMPELPRFPDMPQLELPRFSPYDMVQMLSRSLSPMRTYMEGLDVRDRERVERHLRRAGRSPGQSIGGRDVSQGPETEVEGGKRDGAVFWGSAVLSSGEESSDEEIADVDNLEESSASEESDGEMVDHDDGGVELKAAALDDGDGNVGMLDERAGDEDETMELLGHP